MTVEIVIKERMNSKRNLCPMLTNKIPQMTSNTSTETNIPPKWGSGVIAVFIRDRGIEKRVRVFKENQCMIDTYYSIKTELGLC